MSKFGDELIVSMKQAAAHSSGRKPRGMRVTKLEVPDVKAPPLLAHVARPLCGGL